MISEKRKRYVVDSPENLLQMEFDTALSEEQIFKRGVAKKSEKLNFLVQNKEFMESIARARTELNIRNVYEMNSTNLGPRLWMVCEISKNVEMDKTTNIKKINKMIWGQVKRICVDFELGTGWYDLVCYLIASSGEKPKTTREDKVALSHIEFINADAGCVEVRFTKGVSKKELSILWEILDKCWGNSKTISDDMLMMILEDRNNGMSWSELSEKYKMPKENIRSRLRYYKSKK